ncbi:MAG: alpha/beta hydrolase [Gammaproteobacteria bacterium]
MDTVRATIRSSLRFRNRHALDGSIRLRGIMQRLLLCVSVLCLPFSVSVQAQEGGNPSLFSPFVVRALGDLQYVEVGADHAAEFRKQLVIFVHGTPGSWDAFEYYLNDPIMRDNFHMISVTRPGWRTEDDPKEPSLAAQSASLSPLLRRDRSGKGAILVGHSYGGPVIARTAMDYPELVGGLVFIASTGAPELSGPRWYNRLAVAVPRFVLGAALKGANEEIMPLRPQLEIMLPRWQTLDVPALIVQGGDDSLVNPGNAAFLRDSLGSQEIDYVFRPDQGHFILWEEADLIIERMANLFGE